MDTTTVFDTPDRKIERLINQPGWLKIDPNFDPLRKNQRFQRLVEGK